MSILQLEAPIEVKTPLGHGWAVLFESDAQEHWWTIVLDNGAFVTFTQNHIRAVRSYSHGRGIDNEEMKKIVNG